MFRDLRDIAALLPNAPHTRGECNTHESPKANRGYGTVLRTSYASMTYSEYGTYDKRHMDMTVSDTRSASRTEGATGATSNVPLYCRLDTTVWWRVIPATSVLCRLQSNGRLIVHPFIEWINFIDPSPTILLVVLSEVQ